MIIGLNGRLRSGKDTTYSIIQDLYPHAERVSFADKLKDSAAASLGIDRELMEELKNEEEVRLVFAFPVEGYEELYQKMQDYQMTIREYLQRYGTESHREVFGTDFWVDMALPLDTDHSDRLLVVTDVRFPNEARRVKDLGGQVWKIERDTRTVFSDHPSEQNLDKYVDVFVDNTRSLYELRTNLIDLTNRIMVPC